MAFKIVGVDENSDFPPRVETSLAEKFLPTSLAESGGRLSKSELDAEYVNTVELDGGNAGQVLTRVGDGFGWLDTFAGGDVSERHTDWAISIDPATFRAPVGDKLTIPTYPSPGGGQTTHPSMVFIADGWNGYRYWLAHTPYPGGNDSYENPSIVASNDGIAWNTPDGLVNPLDTPGAGVYNSDTNLILAPNGSLYIFWRAVNNGASTEQIYMRSSSDGITWTSRKLVHSASFANERLVSPAFVYEDSGLSMWAVDIASPANRRVIRKRANVANLNALTPESWGSAETVSLSYTQTGKQPWHISVINVDGLYVALINDATTGQSGTNGDILFATSHDGLVFDVSNSPLIARSAAAKHNNLYHASLVPEINGSTFGFRVIYAGWLSGSPTVWNLFTTFAMSTTAPNTDDTVSALGLVAGRFSAISQNTLVRKSGLAVVSLGAAMQIALNPGSTLVNVPVGFRNLTHNTWVWAWNATLNQPVVVYYDRGDHTLKMGGSIGATQGISVSMVWDIEG